MKKIKLIDTEDGITSEPQKMYVSNNEHIAWDTSELKHKKVFIKFDGTSPANGTFHVNEDGHVCLVMNNDPNSYAYAVSYDSPADPTDPTDPGPKPPPTPPIIIIMDDMPANS